MLFLMSYPSSQCTTAARQLSEQSNTKRRPKQAYCIVTWIHSRYEKTCITANKAVGRNITSIVRTENQTESNSKFY